MASDVIKVEDMTVTYNDGTTAVDNVSLSINQGTFFGFLGPNGAGKTTLVKTLATLLKPTSGSITINGYDTVTDPRKVRESIGYMPQRTSVDEELTARENLLFACDAYNVPSGEQVSRVDELLDLVQLKDVADKRAEAFSGGMQKRLDAATALVHQPPLVFLDEPTTGLDPAARQKLWDYFQRINNAGTTFFLTTQYLEEADKLCDDIAVMQTGDILVRDSPKALKQRVGGDIIGVETSQAEAAAQAIQDAFDATIQTEDNTVSITVRNASKVVTDILIVLRDNDISIQNLSIREPTLDDVFLALTNT